ncbi:type I-F CRISPR-associated protein Csy2 [Pseudomonas sp. GD04058]|uniref:type I-F CRISPR-associated protein Csy2 n=1 Tax=Pseudomonas sp. GD04058 TaxID=2975429 RepID=UPI00244816E2|nr:type I-F CRISPR-associated protein Csy2 [Pseudomonas sp. GD04058]MDG9881966.1 type I-F CRISPR-associated protein Csy2 [Pseudomonas sp. GD04058]
MNELPGFDHLLIVPHLHVQNANAISSPLTHGFPSMTAFIGLMWALERKARAADIDLQFNAIAVVAHDHQELVTDSGYVNDFRLTRNPNDKDGKPAAIVEEGRIHLELSLVFAVQGPAPESGDKNQLVQSITELLSQMRIAGGSIIPAQASGKKHRASLLALTGNPEDRQSLFRSAMWRLLPGFVQVERHDLLERRHAELLVNDPQASPLDAWLSLSRINWRAPKPDPEDKSGKEPRWLNDRQNLGWIVPIPVGYGGLSELHAPGSVSSARDQSTPFRLVESLFSIGQWLSPHRLHSVEQLLWYADSHKEQGLYRCRNHYQAETEYDFD